MKAIIIQFTFGFVAFDENYNFREVVLFKKDPRLAAKIIIDNEDGNLSSEIKSIVNLMLNNDFDHFSFENIKIAKNIEKNMKVNVEVIKSFDLKDFGARMEQIAIESGFLKNSEELVLWNRSVSMEIAKLRIKGASEKRDLVIAQAIQTLDDLDRTVNLFMSRLREWYGVHFPELDRLVDKHETYARLVMNLGERENFSIANLENELIQEERAKKLSKAATNSMGAIMVEEDLSQIQVLSRNILNFYELRKGMEKYINTTMEEIAPNTRTVAGPLLGARLISIAGSLQNLAMRPASTIQVLGAEKALFRSLKTGARPPKHGLIFQHNLLHDAKRWQRGKIARALAGKIAIAVRTDAFKGKYVGDELKKAVDKRLAEIQAKYKDPPPSKEKVAKTESRKPRYKRRRQQRYKKKWRKSKGANKS
ncbi:MAG: C/D box methylation guide ribonucleoprotein complex aNOP56 subunit [Candidatus Bathyarchaeota archaeon]|nr:C/D box methylation guide ribonucleoprotein complex aNOP56 subunit [Candidatus Bathyarchaeota archaeon]